MIKECPCYKGGKDCAERYEYCHSTCKEYKDWRAEKDEDNKAKRVFREDEFTRYSLAKLEERKKRRNEKHRGR